MFSNFFIKRPIFAIVVSIVIVLAGLLSMKELPVEQYPNMSPVQIMVTGVYPVPMQKPWPRRLLHQSKHRLTVWTT